MTTTTARASIATLLVSVLLLAGCGGGDDEDPKPAADSSSDAASGSPSAADPTTDGATSELDEDSFYETITRAQEEAGSFRSTTTTTNSGMTFVLEQEATYDDGQLLGHSKSTAQSPQQVESVVADGVVYLKVDGMGIPSGKWLKIDPEDPANADNPLAALAGLADPEVALEAVGDLESLKLVGPETVKGTETSHYRATVLTANYAEILGLPDDAADLLPAKLPMNMWVDADNRPVKFEMSFEVRGVESTTEQTYYDYGADIDVTVPADSDTVTPSELGLAAS